MDSTRRFPWQRHYEVAITETDPTQLPVLITAAEAAIDARIAEIQAMNSGTVEERQAIVDARNGLRILISELRPERVVEATPGYTWQRPYEAAILETDRRKLPTLIEAAQAAIDARLAEIQSTKKGTPAEVQAIHDAHYGLLILVAETLKG
ncbi:MAG: hypothetical protein WBR11_04360 [Terriglobales bacterium]